MSTVLLALGLSLLGHVAALRGPSARILHRASPQRRMCDASTGEYDQKRAVVEEDVVSPPPSALDIRRLEAELRHPDTSEAPVQERRSLARGLKTAWDFTRPHTVVGSAISIPALFLFALPAGPAAWEVLRAPEFCVGLLTAMVPSLFINLYVTGLNQVTDVHIDRVNKPFLPIPAGRLTVRDARRLVGLGLLLGLGLPPIFSLAAGYSLHSLPLYGVLLGSAALGTVYSCPPFRLKRFPLLAAMCILSVRGALINMCFFDHARHIMAQIPGVAPQLGAMSMFSAPCLAATAFYAVFGIVIALMKDVPDIKGDERAQIRSFSVRKGANFMLGLSSSLVVALFGAVTVGLGGQAFTALAAGTVAKAAQLAAVAGLAAVSGIDLFVRVRNVVATESKQAYKYYMRLWKYFYLSYLVLPFAR
mmetsp:Transcript_2911/g.11783  ORF Transcript_2911/g.11783 Transcript_2911/m.11783 type:complete len:419 (-) Transcript_2911:351-1607(-)